jgi:hypothetical protein
MMALVSHEVALTQAALDFRGCPHMGEVPPQRGSVSDWPDCIDSARCGRSRRMIQSAAMDFVAGGQRVGSPALRSSAG